MLKIHFANCITISRIIFSIILLFCNLFSPMFYFLYIIAGLTDLLDGLVARITNTVSEFGSKLDTFADIIFTIILLMKIIPVLNLSKLIYCWIFFIALIKIFNLVIGYVKYKKIITFHTIFNKLTGISLFLLLFIINFINTRYYVLFILIFATFSAIQEIVYIKNSNNF